MKILKGIGAALFLVMLVGTALAAAGNDDIAAHRDCAHCGMDRKVYGYSRMLVEYVDASQVGLCSLHCAVTEMNGQRDKQVKSLQVADRDSHRLIDADKAIWVIGGKKRGVMTQQPKWAFATEAAARAFVTANGGRVIAWPEALKAAQEEDRAQR